MDVKIIVAGDREIAISLDKMPERLRQHLASRFARLTRRLEQMVGARVPRRTGRLRSLIRSQVVVTRDSVRGRVFVSAEHGKASALEYGAHRRHNVREHVRTIDQVWGRAVSPISVIVGRYQRTANIRAHRFLRDPRRAIRDDVIVEVRGAVNETFGR